MYRNQLGLDEALLIINNTVGQTPFNILYQIEECFGCKLEQFRAVKSNYEEFTINSERKLLFELRTAQENNLICRLNHVDLNDRGQYRIDIVPEVEKNLIVINNDSLAQQQAIASSSKVRCLFQTLDRGSCSLCPIAILLSFILLLTLLEKLFSKLNLLTGSRGETKRKCSQMRDLGRPKELPVGQQSQLVRRQSRPECDAESNHMNSDDRQHQDTGEQQIEIANNPTDSEEKDARPPITTACIETSTVQPEATTNHINDQLANGMESDLTNCDPNSWPLRPRARIDSLDAFRGVTIAGMIMVNQGGAHYWFLQHAAWDGLTPADLVFPFFVFSMGASIAISTRSMLKRGCTFFQMLQKILVRSLLLMVIGLCLNSKWLNGKSLSYLRLTGVLQRFSISYLVVASVFALELCINNWIKNQSLYRIPILSRILLVLFESLAAIKYLAIHVYFTFYFEYSSTCPIGYIGPGGETEGGMYANCTGGAAAWLDHYLLGSNHLYNDHEVKEIFKTQVSHDPEGILGSTTSILLTLIGLQCGKILIKSKNHQTTLLLFLQWMTLLAIGCVLIIIIPINKRLWSLTFVILSACIAYALMTILYIILDVFKWKQAIILKLFISAGKNSIFLYVGHSLLYGMLPWHFALSDETSKLQLLFRLVWSTFVWLLIAHYMAMKKLFIRL